MESIEINKQITEQKNIIEKNASELKDINEKLEKFAYVISHDLKAPLRGMNHLVSWIEEENSDRLKPESQEHLRLLREQVAKMDRLIKGILDYSRTASEHHSREWVEVKSVIDETIELFSYKQNMNISVFPGMPKLFCNKTNLIQLFQNLISNAIKHNDKKSVEVKIYCIEDADFFEFSVEDNGPGIPKEFHGKVFELFQTLSVENEENTGVGLSIIKKIIEENGGKIWIESSTTSGTIFKFTIPKKSEKGEVLYEKPTVLNTLD
jgi:light-regulated signal transduction histidine kinase (bacteriophytochrome)